MQSLNLKKIKYGVWEILNGVCMCVCGFRMDAVSARVKLSGNNCAAALFRLVITSFVLVARRRDGGRIKFIHSRCASFFAARRCVYSECNAL